MRALRRVTQRVRDLEARLGVHEDPTVYVHVVRLWQPGLPKDVKGVVFMKNSRGPGRRFSNDEEAQAWIEKGKKELELPAGSTARIEKNQHTGMPWEEMPAWKKRLREAKERLRREKASLTQT